MNSLLKTSIVAAIIGVALLIWCNMLDWSNGFAAFLGGCLALLIAAVCLIIGLVMRANDKRRMSAPRA